MNKKKPLEYIGDNYDPRNDEVKDVKEVKDKRKYEKQRKDALYNANVRGINPRPTTIKKYNLKKVNGKYV